MAIDGASERKKNDAKTAAETVAEASFHLAEAQVRFVLYCVVLLQVMKGTDADSY